MANYFVYILQSESSGRFYCGYTNNLERRLHQHNDPAYCSTKTTKNFSGPWKIIKTEIFSSTSEAMKQERAIKKRGIRRYLVAVESRRRRD
jgi:putative endonuclease